MLSLQFAISRPVITHIIPLPCEFRHNALSDISNWKHTLSQSFKVLDSAMKKVMNTTHVTVPFVFFSFPTLRSLAWNIPFYNTTISDLLENLPRKNVTCVMCNMLFLHVTTAPTLWFQSKSYAKKVVSFFRCLYGKMILHYCLYVIRSLLALLRHSTLEGIFRISTRFAI